MGISSGRLPTVCATKSKRGLDSVIGEKREIASFIQPVIVGDLPLAVRYYFCGVLLTLRIYRDRFLHLTNDCGETSRGRTHGPGQRQGRVQVLYVTHVRNSWATLPRRSARQEIQPNMASWIHKMVESLHLDRSPVAPYLRKALVE